MASIGSSNEALTVWTRRKDERIYLISKDSQFRRKSSKTKFEQEERVKSESTPSRKRRTDDFVDVISHMPDSEIPGAILAGLPKTRGDKKYVFFAHIQVISLTIDRICRDYDC